MVRGSGAAEGSGEMSLPSAGVGRGSSMVRLPSRCSARGCSARGCAVVGEGSATARCGCGVAVSAVRSISSGGCGSDAALLVVLLGMMFTGGLRVACWAFPLLALPVGGVVPILAAF